jgi:tRNA A37 methylthiotransferase MiaB
MNRKYTRNEYLDRINYIYSKMPEVLLTTDVIVGFPTEDEVSFQDTLDLIKTVEFKKVHIFPYSVRPLTKASQWQLPSYEFMRKCLEKIHKLNSTLQERQKGVICEEVRTNYFKGCGA